MIPSFINVNATFTDLYKIKKPSILKVSDWVKKIFFINTEKYSTKDGR
jgi:hypothetical protein